MLVLPTMRKGDAETISTNATPPYMRRPKDVTTAIPAVSTPHIATNNKSD